jgi:hypothetical protein
MAAAQTSRKVEFRPSIPRRLRPVVEQRGPGSGYQRSFPRIALGASLLGATADDLAGLFNVSEPTIYAWRKEHPAFDKALQEGGQYADSLVARALYRRCLGYDTTVTTIETREQHDTDGNLIGTVTRTIVEQKHVPPDATACGRWLHLRRAWFIEEPFTIQDAFALIRAAQAEAKRRGIDYRKNFEAALETAQRRPTERCPECGNLIFDAMPDEATAAASAAVGT